MKSNLRVLMAVCCLALSQGSQADPPYVPVEWTKFVSVDGQPLPVPEQWLQDEEARIAYGLKLPDVVPKPVPFDFGSSWWKSLLSDQRKLAVQYFHHLCKTEAGEWIFKKVENVDGLYFARPQGRLGTDTMLDPYGPEMPWIQRIFLLTGDKAHDQGTSFIQPPIYNYHFVEQPRRNVAWQAGIKQSFIRLFGYTREKLPNVAYFGRGNDQSGWYWYKDKDPMQVIGIDHLTARYGYTWRGLRRERDREFGIAGGEVLIYDLQTKEVLAVRRQFLIASKNPRGQGKAMWELAARCPQIETRDNAGLEFTQFAFDVIQTIEPSIAVPKQ